MRVADADAQRVVTRELSAGCSLQRCSPMPKVVTFGEIMLRLSPPGFERFFQSPVLGATFGGGEANVAVSLAHFGLDSYFVTRLPAHAHRRRGRQGGSRRGRAHRLHPARRRAASASTSPKRARASARRPSSTTARTRPSPRCSRAPSTGPRSSTARRGSTSRASRRRSAPSAAACTREAVARGEGGRRARQRRPELPQEALDRGRGAGDDAAADGVGRSRHRQRGGHAVGARPARPRHRRHERTAEPGGLPAGGRAADARARAADGGHHAAREPVGERQRLERRALGRATRAPSITASTTPSAWSTASAAATASPPA